ncbi:hypothetical protein HOP52_19210 [Halomonas campisalis]|uniref:Uncharacterized protein n=1 Tax=Billgrantia campisalis TaxID=74661 RepID=A0ABS9PDM9_9GAMM|nr:hypothetical protein [Halomonas campisalis]MCG6659875.1 hypothetical protein [Halomonas campisalis]MDR5865067.1 hypothetical protein [Halomonas campisalis]
MLLIAVVVALMVTGIVAWSVQAGKRFMKAALYHYYLDQSELLREVHGDHAPVAALAYQMAVQKYQVMNDHPQNSHFCFDVLHHQRQVYGTRSAMLAAARHRQFPE